MAKSSISFEKKYFFKHNDRTQKEEPEYLLPKEYRLSNVFDFSAKEAKKRLADFTADAKKNMLKKHNQTLQAKSFVWEAIINLNKNHSLADLKKAVKKLEKETGFKSIQMSIHRDEGRIEKDKAGNNVVIYNFHAHVTFFTLDQNNGQQLFRKDITLSLRLKYRKQIEAPFKLKIPTNTIKILAPKEKRKKSVWGINDQNVNKEIRKQFKEDGHIVYDRDRLSYLQTIVAEELGMERGTVSVKYEADRLGVEVSRPAPGFGHKDFKATEKQKELIKKKAKKIISVERAKIKELKKEILDLGISSRAVHTNAESVINNLIARARAKELSLKAMQAELKQLKAVAQAELATKDAQIANLETKNIDISLDQAIKVISKKSGVDDVFEVVDEKLKKNQTLPEIEYSENKRGDFFAHLKNEYKTKQKTPPLLEITEREKSILMEKTSFPTDLRQITENLSSLLQKIDSLVSSEWLNKSRNLEVFKKEGKNQKPKAPRK